MNVLIVQSCRDLGGIWQNHLRRQGMDVDLAMGQREAIAQMIAHEPAIIVLDLLLAQGCALAVADFASYRFPDARIIFVTNTTFFSDGSIFSHSPNACAFLQSQTPPEDLAAMVAHFGARTGTPIPG